MNSNFHFFGTSLGGLFVLEPWITPSLFYQFLGATDKWGAAAPNHIGLDSSTFCTALGKEEANIQLRRHWDTWITEDHVFRLSQSGVQTLRIPVGDWMFATYEPYTGCWDGANEVLDRILRLCEKYNIKVVLDIHAHRDSQVSTVMHI
jgi:glucan 1,3-beta-glucosidase